METTTTPAPYILTDPPRPGTEEWRRTITASKVPPMIKNAEGGYAGFGYVSAWEQFEEIQGRLVQDHDDYMLNRFAEAHAAEQPAAEWWLAQQDNPDEWELSDGEVAYTHPGYTFNGRHPIATVDRVATHIPTGHQEILEIKNPDRHKVDTGWLIQHYAQREWSGITSGTLIIFPKYDDPQALQVPHNPDQIATIMADIRDFAALLEADTPPEGGDLELADEDAAALESATEAYDNAKADLEKVKKRLAGKLGTHKRATYNGRAVVTKVPGRFAKTRVPADYAEVIESDEFQTTTKKFNEKAFAEAYPEAYAAALGPDTYKFL